MNKVCFARLLSVSVVMFTLLSCIPSLPGATPESSSPESGASERSPANNSLTNNSPTVDNPLIGTWRPKPGGVIAPYFPCQEITFEPTTSFCDDTGAATTYQVREDSIVVDDGFVVQVVRFKSANIISMEFPSVGEIEFERVR